MKTDVVPVLFFEWGTGVSSSGSFLSFRAGGLTGTTHMHKLTDEV